MKDKLKKIVVPFILMIIFEKILSSEVLWDLGLYCPHVGLFFVFGLLLGPYGALGGVFGHIVISLIDGCVPTEIVISSIYSFGVSYLAYKLWYSDFRNQKIMKPKLDNIYHLTIFLSIIILCGFIFSVVHETLFSFYFFTPDLREYSTIAFFLNFTNIAFITGIISIWLSKKIDFIETPKTQNKQVNKKLYRLLFYSLLIVTAIALISKIFCENKQILLVETILIGILLFCYLTKPFVHKIKSSDRDSIIEDIIQKFLIIILAISFLGMIISHSIYHLINLDIDLTIYVMQGLIITDAIIILSFIPGMIILRYMEKKVIEPLSSFSEIEKFIKENEKIESEGLVNLYSKYLNEKNEIGTLAKSYTELINHNNNYIENIHEIEGEKERIKAELDIASKIQDSTLPHDAIKNENYYITGYSHPAKEVGGDFFDYYELDDDNLAIVIGDVSDKGVPAALLAMITQVMIKQILNHERDPSKVLNLINNELYKNNPEAMFVSLWLGIYNKNTKKLTFSNAGHTLPLIKEDDKFEYLDIDSGIILAILEDFEYKTEEITLSNELILYTDGITDATNDKEECYGEDRLLEFFNKFKSDDKPIIPLLDDINDFIGKQEQFDDMTLIYLKIK
jgi:sigma-B regulation protein RsbU (phosphoserine phosphatase)